MAEILDYWNTGNRTENLTDEYGCSEDEAYKTDLQFKGDGVVSVRNGVCNYTITDFNLSPNNNGRCAGWTQKDQGHFITFSYINTSTATFTYKMLSTWSGQEQYYYNVGNVSGITFVTYSGETNFSTNIPIFETFQDALDYLDAVSQAAAIVAIRKAINYKQPETSPDGYDFEITNCWTYGIWLNDTQPPVSEIHYRNFRAKMTGGKFSLYPISGIDDNKLKMGIKNDAEFYEMQYSEDGRTWIDTDTFPYEFFYRKRVNELSPNPNTYLGYALTFGNTHIPVFEDEEKAEDYINGDIDISEATNWGEISGSYPTHNGTGDEEDATTFGEVCTRNVFSQLYLCNTAGLYEISNSLFDFNVTTLQGAWNDIKKGLEMYGTDPMQVVQGLRYYPFDLSTIFTNVDSQHFIYFGAYQLTMQNSVKKIVYCNGSIDLGSIYLKRTFNDWRDFEPYTKLSIYLPYVGSFPLDAKKYYNKTIDIKYFIDLRTGACTACLIADDVLLDWFDGIIGTEMPITLTDYAGYAQSQLNIIMRNAGIGIAAEGMTGNIAAKGMKAAMGYNENANAVQDAALAGDTLKSSLSAQTAGSYGKQAMIAAGVGGAALLGTVAVGTGMKTAFDMMRTGTAAHTKTRPASSAMINQYLPQYAYFRFEILEIDESPYLNALYGRPTNESGLIQNFSGYLECEDVSLICPIATDNERQEIIDLLKTGIYITPP